MHFDCFNTSEIHQIKTRRLSDIFVVNKFSRPENWAQVSACKVLLKCADCNYDLIDTEHMKNQISVQWHCNPSVSGSTAANFKRVNDFKKYNRQF